ncbi:MAG: uridine diphosphate-N-acetylglucosamine-binding protein YvcK [Acidobacteria bacterium]|nr:uridine diphosphate-N-acetylglucosamine-binding protein YvcK [Acidobacteriota bacterium]
MAVGGGSGLAVVLRGLKHLVGTGSLRRLTAVVTVTDDGGSSGRLRRDFGVLPPGDIRNCIVALADDEDLLARLFQYRFPNGEGLSGHSFGNLFLTALTGITGDFYQAVLTAESILSVRGKILPATLTDVRLRGRGRSGAVYEGEVAVGHSGEPLEALELEPAAPVAFEPAVSAIRAADLVLLGPGSLYTSILPNLMIPGIRSAIRDSGAPVVLLLNLMTQPGETDGMDASAHLEAIERHAGEGLVDAVMVHDGELPPGPLTHYAQTGSRPVVVDRARIEARGVQILPRDLLAEGSLLRHDPAKLSGVVLDLMAGTAG